MSTSSGDRPSADDKDFERSLAELEALVAKLEGGELPLAESLALFEQGVTLTRQCHARLAEARARVEILLKEGTRPFDPEATGGDE